MKICDLNNLFEIISLTSQEVEAQIQNYKLVFDQTRNEKVEWGLKLPMFVPSFYKFIKTKKLVPSQNDYWLFYVSENKDYLTDLKLTREEKIGVRARVFRTYPSLVRDLHFGLQMKENNIFRSVFYNEILDIEYGVDLVVENINGILLGLNLFTKTKAAEHARIVKEFRPKKPIDFACCEIPIIFKGSKKCGDFFLYSDREINFITEKINTYLEGK